jgi:hypothetical protein
MEDVMCRRYHAIEDDIDFKKAVERKNVCPRLGIDRNRCRWLTIRMKCRDLAAPSCVSQAPASYTVTSQGASAAHATETVLVKKM